MKQYSTDMRTALADTLIQLEQKNDRIIWLDSDLMASSGIGKFKAAYPERVINCGIQEANMFGVAAGLSEEGFIPFVHSFSAFASRRIADQIFMSGIYAHQNVRVIGSDPGLSAGPNGGTHISLEDVGILRSMPNTTILDPCDPIQLKAVVACTAEQKGIFYIRLMRKTKDQFYEEGTSFEIGKASVLREGSDLSIITCGTVCIREALKAAELLESEHIHTRIIDMFTIKPIDQKAVLRAAGETKAVITLENHNLYNGLGSAVAEVLAEHKSSVPFRRLGVPDQTGEVGTLDYLMEKFHMNAAAVVRTAKDMLNGVDIRPAE